MKLSRKQYDPEYYHNLALEELSVISDLEAQSWFNHPCTRYMLNALQGDMAGIVLCWMDGAYAKGNIEEHAQENAKRLGQIQTIDEIVQTIEHLGKNKVEGESYDDQDGGVFNID